MLTFIEKSHETEDYPYHQLKSKWNDCNLQNIQIYRILMTTLIHGMVTSKILIYLNADSHLRRRQKTVIDDGYEIFGGTVFPQ